MAETLIHRLGRCPELLDVLARRPDKYPYYLDSAATGPAGDHSLLLRTGGEALCLEKDGNLSGPGRGDRFLDRFDDWYRREAAGVAKDSDLPFTGGWFVYLGYELAGEIEPVLHLPRATDCLPTAFAARCEGAIIVRHGAQPRTFLVAESEAVLQDMLGDLEDLQARRGETHPAVARLQADPARDYEIAVARIQDYLRDGDVFQVNLSRGWEGRFAAPADPVELYGSLRLHNPAPFAGLMLWRGCALLSSSPERLVEVRGEMVQTRPIAGTHPRGGDEQSDLDLARSLLAHPKERAEHVMLIDLERNDLGRVCEAGSVEVSELMVVESYPHVHHMVSNVRGRLLAGKSPADVIRAVFPGGTITGCPKVRCMEIIAELEGKGRGFYTGSMGYVGRDGSMDMNILIRSMLLNGRAVSFRTGAGIVADSIAAREVAETEAKARGLMAALGCRND